MSNIIIPGNPECPLCLKRMKEVKVKTKNGLETMYICAGINCLISINALDPAVSKWNMKEPPSCTICGHKMRAFFRVLDRYLKCQCPHCLKGGKLVQIVRGQVKDFDPKWSVDPNAK